MGPREPNYFVEIENELQIPCLQINNIEDCKCQLEKYTFKILTCNIRSITHNIAELLVVLERGNIFFDILVLTECWLRDSVYISQLPGYQVFITQKITNKCGGVTIYVKEGWPATALEPEFDDANCLLIKIPNIVTVLGIYRSPSQSNIDRFLNSLDLTLTNLDSPSRIIVTGDMNINILDENLNGVHVEYLCLMAEHGLLSAINLPTRQRACLDHAFIKTKDKTIGIVCSCSMTDHDLVVIGTNVQKTATVKRTRLVTKIDYDAIRQEISEIDWTNVTIEADVNTAVCKLNDIISDQLRKHTKTVRLSRRQFNLRPWITPGLIRCIRHRDKLHQGVRRKPSDLHLKEIYLRYRNFCNKLLSNLKEAYEKQKLLDNHTNPRGLWKTIRNICNIPLHDQTRDALLQGAQNGKEALEKCNSHFVNAGSNLVRKTMQKNGIAGRNLGEATFSKNRCLNSFFLSPTDEHEVCRLLSNIKMHSAPGADGFGPALLKNIKDSIVEPLTYICNLSLSTGVFPEYWKLAVVSPIHKSGSKDNVNNYRPISLLCILSKILEKIVNTRLTSFLEVNNLLSDRQFGFRQHKSTEDAMQLLIGVVSKHLDNRQRCIGVFLDLAKAFDTISIPRLLKKLEEFGVRGIASQWFCSYLSQRRQCCKVGGLISQQLYLEHGIPQGSVLGPTLFCIYINDILSVTLKNANSICFADDTAVIFHGNDWDSAFSAAEEGMRIIQRWLDANLLTLNAEKSSFLAFHIRRSTDSPRSYLRVHNQSCRSQDQFCNCEKVSRCQVVKYLGVSLDENLNFKHHLKLLATRLRKGIFIMKILRRVASLETRRMIYYSLIQSQLLYCIGVWGGAGKTAMMGLERAQRAVLKVMLSKPRRYCTNSLYTEAELLRVRQLYISHAVLKTHVHEEHNSTTRSSRFSIIPTPRIKTGFAGRFSNFLYRKIYNSVVLKNPSILHCPKYRIKRVVREWLLQKDYIETESLLSGTQ